MTSPFLLHQLLAATAVADPQRTMIVDGETVFSYGYVEAESNRLAHLLLSLGVERGDRVGVLLEKSALAVTAIYGVMKAGACYVPCDADMPPARLASILSDCSIRIVLTSGSLVSRLLDSREYGARPQCVLALDVESPSESAAPEGVHLVGPAALASESITPPGVRGSELDLAYILYTSGSTGRPKGVMVSHRNALAFAQWAVKAVDLCGKDRLASHAPFHFDLSVLDLFASAMAGASTWLVPREAMVFPTALAQFIRESGLTVWYSVPSALTMLTQRGGIQEGDFPELRAMLFAGEVFPSKYLRRLMQLLPHVRFANLFGPTETNVCTAFWVPAPPAESEQLPIGWPIDNVDVYIDDGTGTRQDATRGELVVRGPTVARGYWGDPIRSRRFFNHDALSPSPLDGVYRTGDIVERGPDGVLMFLGRRDGQVKSRGYRIDLADVEFALLRHSGVFEAAVVAIPDARFTNLISATVVAEPGLTSAEIKQHCATWLPRYMVPDDISFAVKLPLTSTGKLDREVLKVSRTQTGESEERDGGR